MTVGEAVRFTEERRAFHAALLDSILTVNSLGVTSNADKDSRLSVAIARHIAQRLQVGIDVPVLEGRIATGGRTGHVGAEGERSQARA